MERAEMKAFSRNLIRENTPKLFIVAIVYVIVTAAMSELEFRLPGTKDYYDRILEAQIPDPALLMTNFKPTGTVLAFLIALATPIVRVGFMSYCLKLTRGIEADVKSLLDGFLFFLKIIALNIVTGIFVFLWSLLLVFPGVIAAYRYSQAFYILIDDPEKGVLDCIRESKEMMKGKKADLFILDLSFIGWILLDAVIVFFVPIPLPIVSIWLAPYQGLTHAKFYSSLLPNQ